MDHTIHIATVQMDAVSAPLTERLARAETLAAQAAAAGAQLVVLPELFNLGYAYADENFRRAEPPDGPTATWMRQTAARLGVHLAGSLLLLDHDEIYNALLLYAPDGRCWRYDKNYPWGWERAYFRESDRITISHTDLGDIGMLICWDAAHADLWRRYAGQVDLMLISSCPPDAGNPTYHLAGGTQITTDQMGPLFRHLQHAGPQTFDATVRQQAAWLGVPAIHTVGCGQVTTAIPNPLVSFASILPAAPWLIPLLPRARNLQATYTFVQACQIIDASGQPLAGLTQAQGEAWTMAQVAVPEVRPSPRGAQPTPPVPRLTYWLSDVLLPGLVLPIYRRGARQAWGQRMAPPRPTDRRWLLALAAAGLIGVLLGRWIGRHSHHA